MNHLLDYIYLAEYIAPACTALGCAVLLLLSYGNRRTYTDMQIKRVAVLYMCATCFAWAFIAIYVFFPGAFVYIQSIGYLALLWAQVLFFRLFHILTASKGKERFSPWHYAVPVIICTTLAVWSLLVPYDVQLDITLGRGRVIPEGYGVYARLFLSKMPVWLLYCAFYLALTIVRLVKYYKKVNARQSLVRRPARWVLLLVSLMISAVVASPAAFFMRITGLYLSLIMMTASVIEMAQQIVLTVTVLRRDYLLYVMFPPEDAAPPLPAAGVREKKKYRSYSHTGADPLTRDRFEAWFGEHKPWLDPSLRITDLAEAMDVNRSYLSGFVNRTYGMNFSRYVNDCRMRELDRLAALAANRGRPLKELVTEAGFGSVKYYNSIVAEKKRNGL